MNRATNTREKIIERGRELLQSRGFEGFSYKDIATHLGIRNAAVHYHFPAKSDLGLTLIEEFTAEVKRRIDKANSRRVPLKDQLDAYFEQVGREVCEHDWAICPMGAFSTAFEAITPEMQQAIRRLGRLLHDWMADVLAKGRAAGDFRFAGQPEEKAMEIAAAVQGARQLSRIHGRNVVAQVAEQIRRDLYQ